MYNVYTQIKAYYIMNKHFEGQTFNKLVMFLQLRIVLNL